MRFPITRKQYLQWLDGMAPLAHPCGDLCPLEEAVLELTGQAMMITASSFAVRGSPLDQRALWSPLPEWAKDIVRKADSKRRIPNQWGDLTVAELRKQAVA